jgi:hypothetical protein
MANFGRRGALEEEIREHFPTLYRTVRLVVRLQKIQRAVIAHGDKSNS